MVRESQSSERGMSTVEQAMGYVKRMIASEAKGWGDQENAQHRIEAKYGISFWALERLRTGRAKSVDMGLFQRIRGAYLDLCERQVAKIQSEIAIERALGSDTLEDLEAEAASLAARIAAKKALRK